MNFNFRGCFIGILGTVGDSPPLSKALTPENVDEALSSVVPYVWLVIKKNFSVVSIDGLRSVARCTLELSHVDVLY